MSAALALRPDSRVCIVLLTGLGDVVMGLPVAHSIRSLAPVGHTTWIAEPAPAEVLRHHRAVDEVLVYEKSRGIAGVLDLRRKLAGRRFDVTLNLNIYFKSVWPTALSGAPVRIGFDRDRARDGVWIAANRKLPPRPRRHTLDMFLEFATFLGDRNPAVRFDLTFDEAELDARTRFFDSLDGRPVVGLVPASANPRKDWLADRWAALADALEHDYGYRVVFLGGPSERERNVVEAVRATARGSPVNALGRGVRALMWTISGCDFVIAPDTGPVHLARALEVPVIGLYGHTNPYRIGPYGTYHDLWVDRYTEPGENPDPSRFDPHYGRLEQISVNDVLGRVDRARARYGVGG